MNVVKNELSKALKANRKLVGLTQTILAQKVGCTPAYVHHVENSLSSPGPKLLKKWLKVTKINPKMLRAHLTASVNEQLSQMGL